MDYFVWRPRAKVVAIFDLALICLGVPGLFVLVSVGKTEFLDVSKAIYSGDETELNDSAKSTRSDIYWIIGITAVICIMMVALKLWAAVKLFRTGSTEKDPKKALKMVLFWGNVTFVFLALAIVGQLIEFNVVGMLITAVWKGTSLYVVSQYTDYLETYLKMPVKMRPRPSVDGL